MTVRSRLRKAPAALLFPPSVLHRRYAIECEVGHGGCARVYRAWDAQQGQPVAIKRAHLGQKGSDLLYHEAQVLDQLQHPAIPTFLEYFEEDGRSYLVEAWRLGSAMSGLRFFSLSNVLWIGLRCCEVLAYLHHLGIFHRDLKPGNVLLEEDRLSLLDFGLAYSRDLAYSPGELPVPRGGSPGYASPEQWEGVLSSANDIYSLGMLLGCALTDVQPEEVRKVRAFSALWDNPAAIPHEDLPLLALLDQMIAVRSTARPSLRTVQLTLTRLERQLVSC